MPPGGVEDTATVLWPHPPARLPGSAGHPERDWGYPTRDCYTWAAASPTVRCLFVLLLGKQCCSVLCEQSLRAFVFFY